MSKVSVLCEEASKRMVYEALGIRPTTKEAAIQRSAQQADKYTQAYQSSEGEEQKQQRLTPHDREGSVNQPSAPRRISFAPYL